MTASVPLHNINLSFSFYQRSAVLLAWQVLIRNIVEKTFQDARDARRSQDDNARASQIQGATICDTASAIAKLGLILFSIYRRSYCSPESLCLCYFSTRLVSTFS